MIIIIFTTILLITLSFAETIVEAGKFFTAEEVTLWRQRVTSGPYKTAGDVSSNSPGDWERIVANAEDFKADSHQEHIPGITSQRCITEEDYGLVKGMPGHPATQDASHGWLMVNSAFVSLVLDDVSYATPVINALMQQIGEAGVNHADAQRFCTSAYSMQSGALISWPLWIAKLAIAYDYVKVHATAEQQQSIEAWLSKAATYWEGAGSYFARDRFPQRDTYTKDSDYVVPPIKGEQGTQHKLYDNGPQIYGFHTGWSNTKLAAVHGAAIAAIVSGNTAVLAAAERMVKEAIMFATWPQGGTDDFQRSYGGKACTGLSYSSDQLGSMVGIADVLARNGNTALYNYSTTYGWKGTEGNDTLSNTPKSLLNSAKWWYAHADHTLVRYSEGHAGQEDYVIDSECGSDHAISDLKFSLGNLYWKDASITTHYLRQQSSQMPSYPTQLSQGPSSWGGRHGMWPGLLFQYGQLEGVVNPYVAVPVTPIPPIPPGEESTVITVTCPQMEQPIVVTIPVCMPDGMKKDGEKGVDK